MTTQMKGRHRANLLRRRAVHFSFLRIWTIRTRRLRVRAQAFREASPRAAGERAHLQLSLRANPRATLTPANVLVVGEVLGGGDLEDFHCPAVEWDGDDGTRSAHEADCAPFEDGAGIERQFTARHVFRGSGFYNVRLTLSRANRRIVAAAVRVSVAGGVEPQ